MKHDYEEFYDLKKNPLEKKNLAGDPEYQDEIVKMRERYQELKERVR